MATKPLFDLNRLFKEALKDSTKALILLAKTFGVYFWIIGAIALLIGLFTKDIAIFIMYGIRGLIYISIIPFIIFFLFLGNAYFESKIKKWLRIFFICLVVLIILLPGAYLHIYCRSAEVIIVSEAYVYSVEFFNYKDSTLVYTGQPDCLTEDCLDKFSGNLPLNRYESLPKATFRISKRFPFGNYIMRVIFGRNAYRDTTNIDLYLHSKTDTSRIYSRHWIRLQNP